MTMLHPVFSPSSSALLLLLLLLLLLPATRAGKSHTKSTTDITPMDNSNEVIRRSF